MKKKQAVLGLFCAIGYFAWKIALFYTDRQHEILARFPVAPLLGLLGLAIIYAVVRYTPAPFSPVEGFKSGARTALVAALATMVFVFVYYRLIDPFFFSVQNAEVKASIGLLPDAAQRAQALENFENNKKFFDPVNYSALTLSGVAAFGMLMSAVTAGLYEMFRKFNTM